MFSVSFFETGSPQAARSISNFIAALFELFNQNLEPLAVGLEKM
jgi:hypothetical protein